MSESKINYAKPIAQNFFDLSAPTIIDSKAYSEFLALKLWIAYAKTTGTTKTNDKTNEQKKIPDKEVISEKIKTIKSRSLLIQASLISLAFIGIFGNRFHVPQILQQIVNLVGLIAILFSSLEYESTETARHPYEILKQALNILLAASIIARISTSAKWAIYLHRLAQYIVTLSQLADLVVTIKDKDKKDEG
ncbi:MAG: hypothetical protein VXZ72_05335, partial [Chlamydiota bacterium]|nr:hypothetical protein [Chlamydiota bacterium]